MSLTWPPPRKSKKGIAGTIFHCATSDRLVSDTLYLQYEMKILKNTRSIWLNCAIRDDEAVYLVSIGHYEAVAVGN